MQLTEKEMIDLWLLSKGYEPLRTDATIIRTDGVDIRAIARLECRRWYHRLLLEGDPSLLIPEEMAGDPTVTRHATDRGSLIVTMPTAVVRPLCRRRTHRPARRAAPRRPSRAFQHGRRLRHAAEPALRHPPHRQRRRSNLLIRRLRPFNHLTTHNPHTL